MEYRIREEYGYCVIETKGQSKWLSCTIDGKKCLVSSRDRVNLAQFSGVDKIEKAKEMIETWRAKEKFETKFHYV